MPVTIEPALQHVGAALMKPALGVGKAIDLAGRRTEVRIGQAGQMFKPDGMRVAQVALE